MKDSKQVSLFINTATKALQFALLYGDKIVKSENGNPKEALEKSHVMIQELLNQFSLSLQDVDSYYCLLGPGSNTGIRLGLTIPRTVYAFDSSIHLYGISTLHLFLDKRKEKQAALSDRNGNLYFLKKEKGLVSSHINKADIKAIENSPIVIDEMDALAKEELSSYPLVTISVIDTMVERRNDFEDFSTREKEYLPLYSQKI